MIYNSIQAVCPDGKNVEWENDFYSNVYLSGGNMLFKYMDRRLENELKKLCVPF